ncbi:MAG: tRNA (guanosine(37)-N1)-methyltransferase TrmD [Pseudomonadota bacterium]
MQIHLITLLPDIFTALNYGICGRAIKNNLLCVNFYNPRDYAQDKYHTVDDKPYGGGPGMLLKVEPLIKAINAAQQNQPKCHKTIYLSPQGTPLKQQHLQGFLQLERLNIVCGRYEGIDQRVIDLHIEETWSIGDYVLSGGEFAALVLIDAITRLLPGALGDDTSAIHESFSDNLLDYPQYTRPENFQGVTVPEVLLSGHHQQISRWRLQQSLGQTWLKRPDLLRQRQLNTLEKELLEEFITAWKARHSTS